MDLEPHATAWHSPKTRFNHYRAEVVKFLHERTGIPPPRMRQVHG